MLQKVEESLDIGRTIDSLNNLIELLNRNEATLGDLLFELQNLSLAQGGLSNLSRNTGLGRESLYKILSHDGNPRLNTFIEVINALNLNIKFVENTSKNIKSYRNALVHSHPDLAKQWHPTKNFSSPAQIGSGSHIKTWWVCSRDNTHEWAQSVIKRSKGSSCPMCSGKIVSPSTSLSSTHPQLAAEWSSNKNSNLVPEVVRAGSNRNVWWQCSKNSEHEWQAKIYSRALGIGCPFCTMKFKNGKIR